MRREVLLTVRTKKYKLSVPQKLREGEGGMGMKVCEPTESIHSLPRYEMMLTSESLPRPASLLRRGGAGLRDQLDGALVSRGVERCRDE